MTKAELIERIAGRKDLPRDLTKKVVTQIVDAVFLEIGDYFIRARVGGRKPARLAYPGFGTFTKRRRLQRIGRNPRTGQPITIPSQTTVVFAPGQELRDLLNNDTRKVTAG
jgi:integration host factor subunit beta